MSFSCCFIKCLFSVVMLFLLVSLCGNAQEATGPSWFGVKSKTVFLSAKCVIENTAEEKDRERTNVGIVESVDLIADGKSLSDGVAVVDWVLTAGRDLASLEKNEEDDKSAKLTKKKRVSRQVLLRLRLKLKKWG